MVFNENEDYFNISNYLFDAIKCESLALKCSVLWNVGNGLKITDESGHRLRWSCLYLATDGHDSIDQR